MYYWPRSNTPSKCCRSATNHVTKHLFQKTRINTPAKKLQCPQLSWLWPHGHQVNCEDPVRKKRGEKNNKKWTLEARLELATPRLKVVCTNQLCYPSYSTVDCVRYGTKCTLYSYITNEKDVIVLVFQFRPFVYSCWTHSSRYPHPFTSPQ